MNKSSSYVGLSLRSAALVAGFAMLFATAGCGGTVMRVHKAQKVSFATRWAVIPVVNHSDTPQAGERVEAMLAPVLRSRGIAAVERCPAPRVDEARAPGPSAAHDEQRRRQDGLAWAREQKVGYALVGSVEEWRYKGSLEAEPAVGLSLEVVEVGSGQIVWSASGTRAGSGDETTSGVALKLMDTLVGEMDVAR